MTIAAGRGPHTFHIPVMGTGFMIDAPLKVARYGIDSVVSLVDDILIEQMRRFHCRLAGEPYEPISSKDPDARALRITAYLDLMDRLVQRQVEELRGTPFEPGSEITRYFELLPPSPLEEEYRQMLAETDPARRKERQDCLRRQVVAGSIDVNIMSKGDRDLYRDGQKLPAMYSDASAAFRGFALSTLRSSIVLSAGMNPRLYGYAAEFDDFFPDAEGQLKKKIVLKVSDYHSAAIQGRFLAKKGLWVSEFRIESGLNCGGHAFATKGLLIGPILEEFQEKKSALVEQLYGALSKSLRERGRPALDAPPPMRITVQGGIGTAEEDRLLREDYGADGTGWGTPFLLVPEVTNVDPEHLDKLSRATEEDVYLSNSSPFGLPYWNLRTSASENARRERIADGHPGSACPKGYVQLFNTEFTEHPICTASREYQKQKLEQLAAADMPEAERALRRQAVMEKSCICHDLAGGATLKNGLDSRATPAICCGPNIVNFSRVATLDEMVGHIYGRLSLLNGRPRPHVFLREIALYLEYVRDQLAKQRDGLASNPAAYYKEFKENLLQGIEHYRRLVGQLAGKLGTGFLEALESLRGEVNGLPEGA